MLSRLCILTGIAATLIVPSTATAQGTFTWNFGTVVPVFTGPVATASSSTGSGATAGSYSIGNSFGTVTTPISTLNFIGSGSGGFNIGNAVNDANPTFSTAAPYFEVTLNSTSPGIRLTGFTFFFRHDSTGAKNYSLRASNDSFSTDLLSASAGTSDTWLAQTNGVTPTNLGSGAVSLRLYVFNGTSDAVSGTINTQIDDVVISYSPVPEPATMLGLSTLGLSAVGLVRRIRRTAVVVN